jgi:glycerol-3-phosphate dehydrogenase (NAD(P)+)
MRSAAVLGSGYMGGAITFPLADRGFDVRLWGTWLDDEIIDRCARGGSHPRLGLPLRKGVRCFPSDRLADALDGADLLFIAVTSEGFVPVFDLLLREGAPVMSGRVPALACLTKGFVESGGASRRISEHASRACGEKGLEMDGWISVGGPVKAVELAHGVPTATAVAGSNLRAFARDLATSYYRVMLYGGDVTGLEICSALKNVYAIAMGIARGLHGRDETVLHDNHRAFIFSWALEELAAVVSAAGGSRETVFGFPGCGDLFVTQASGRNGRFGRMIGEGVEPSDAYRRMREENEIAEGYAALRLGVSFIASIGVDVRRLPLLDALDRVLFHGGDVREVMTRFVAEREREGALTAAQR